ncbi:MAG: M15 family metallopeptidase [Cyanobacteria bacterium P01_F01_bin.53]
MSNSPKEDIPPARRQSTEISLAEIESIGLHTQPKRSSAGRLLSLLFLVGIAGIGVWQWKNLSPYVMPPVNGAANSAKTAATKGKDAVANAVTSFQPSRAETGLSSTGLPSDTETTAGQSSGDPGPGPSVLTITEAGSESANDKGNNRADNTSANPVASADGKPEELLNHRRYEEAPQESLVYLNDKSNLRLKPDAQTEVTAMIAKAKSEGIKLGIVSGFRTIEDQDYLYFDVKAERGESAKTRAEVSAPPGYSEHHTGYAVDFIDEGQPDTHVEESFETTPAFRWLKKNAAFYNFEMSFPDDPSSPLSYEPWHWRYVGNQESLELFYK